jgi:hypothetical protein
VARSQRDWMVQRQKDLGQGRNSGESLQPSEEYTHPLRSDIVSKHGQDRGIRSR